MSAKFEGERSFLVRLERLPDVPGERLRQAYLVRGAAQFRVREKGKGWLIAAKAGSKVDRHEIETALDAGLAEQIFALCPERIDKVRYTEGPWEVDCFLGSLVGLAIMEIEDPPADLPAPPSYVTILRELTGDERFENQNLATLDAEGVRALLAEVGVGGG